MDGFSHPKSGMVCHGSPLDARDPNVIARMADASPASEAFRREVFKLFRRSDPPEHKPDGLPPLYGDTFGDGVNPGREDLLLTGTQYRHYVTAPTCAGAVGLLLACGQKSGRNQGKAGRGAKNQRLNGLVFGGKEANRLRFSRCRLQRLCVLSYLYPLGAPDKMVVRELGLMIFDGAPVAAWEGESLQALFERLCRFQAGEAEAARTDAEREAFASFPSPTADDADFMLHLLRRYDKGFRYWIDAGNVGNRATLDLLLHPYTQPGFSDSGAHMTNMVWEDGSFTPTLGSRPLGRLLRAAAAQQRGTQAA